MTIKKLSRKAINEGLDQVPFADILGAQANRTLTGKERKFAIEVAKGSTGSAAYRSAYNTKAKPKTQGNQAHKLKAKPHISAEIEAYKLALEHEKHSTPAALRALVIHSLVQVLTDSDTPPAVKVAAAKVAGSITEVAAFTERRETKTITSSIDARAKVMTELKRLMLSDASDVEYVDAQADSLLAELETHRTPTPQASDQPDPDLLHTIPSERSKILPNSDTPLPQEHPPADDIFDVA